METSEINGPPLGHNQETWCNFPNADIVHGYGQLVAALVAALAEVSVQLHAARLVVGLVVELFAAFVIAEVGSFFSHGDFPLQN